jgi:minor extracellular serine protease Vpr
MLSASLRSARETREELSMRVRQSLAVIVAMATLAAAGPALSAAGGKNAADGATTSAATVDVEYALVQLNGEPLSTYVKTKPGPGKKIDFNNTTTKSYRAKLSALRNEFKKWLQVNAPKARITGSWDISLNAVGVKLNGTTLEKLRTSPQVRRVEYQGLYRPNAIDPDLSLVSAYDAWAAVGGASRAGAGVKIGIVDSGIDQDHPCFDDTGYTAPAGFPRGQQQYTSNKVIVAKVFNNKGNQNGFDARAVDSHGTHVAGTAACNVETPAEVGGVTLPYAPSGVAPRAFLGNYNVFPGNVDNARSEDILNALDAAYVDGMDVVNMSLGGGASGIQDLLTIAVDDLDIANMVIAVSAGNEGDGDPDAHPPLPPGHYTVGSPGSAARALTAGASSVGHRIATTFDVAGVAYDAVAGDFPTVTAPLTAPLESVIVPPVNAASGFSEACGALPAGSLTGRIALIGRGTCDFSFKIREAELAGAIAAIVVNRVPGDPFPMGSGESPDGIQPTIPSYMIGLDAGIAIRTTIANGTAGTINLPAYQDTGRDNRQADFSSQGPTDVDFRVKPDLMAPGENVVSSVPGTCGALGCWAFFNGTSMASPHLAGAAAVVRAAHPTWSAEQVRSAIVNTARLDVLTSVDGSALQTDINVTGAGLLDVAGAVSAVAAIAPVSTSFGAVPALSGQTRSAVVTISNLGGSSRSWQLAVTDASGSGVAFTLSRSVVVLAPGASTTVTVTMTAAKGADLADHQAWLRVLDGGATVAHSALYVFVK